MTTKIKKWGNSLALRIPKNITSDFNLKEGSQVKIGLDKKGIILKPLKSKKLKLVDLVNKITPANKHKDFFKDKRAGKEIW